MKKINLNQVKKELSKPATTELVTIGLTALFAIYLIVVSTLMAGEPRFSVPGFIAAGSSIGLIAFAIFRLKMFSKIDYISDTVLGMQKILLAFQQKRNRWGWIELVLGIVAATMMWPLVLVTGFQIDVYNEISSWLAAVIVVAVVAAPITIIFERYYQKRLKNARALLDEIEGFEREGS
jgi:hypothetical protein